MSLLDARRLNAFWVMGWALVKHVLGQPFASRGGSRSWLSRLSEESLGAVPPRAWELFAGASRCVGCGVCDVLGRNDEAPSEWILSMARQPADAALARERLDRLAELAPAIEGICPARLRVADMVQLCRDNAEMLRKV